MEHRRVSTGIDGLDEVTEGGFPEGSLILLAGNPGTGKTVFSSQFLAKGAMLNEPALYASFAESKETLVKNLSRHLHYDFGELDSEGKLKILDFTAVKEEAVSIILKEILAETQAMNAKRLVIDSFSAMAQAFKETTDVRIVVHTVLSKIVRQMGCTTIMIEEIPIGESRIGWGVEEFVADGVIKLEAKQLDGRPLRDLDIIKLRGTRLGERQLLFTLEGGFKVFPPFKPKSIKESKRFQEIKDSPTHLSTGSRDLDKMLSGGLPRGTTVLLDLDERTATTEYHLLVMTLAANFAACGRGIWVLPTSGVDYSMLEKLALRYGFTEKEFRNLVLVSDFQKGLPDEEEKPNLILLKSRSAERDFHIHEKAIERLANRLGQPVLTIAGMDSLINAYGENKTERVLNLGITRTRSHGSVALFIVKAGHEGLVKRTAALVDIYLKLTREHGSMLLYGVKPRTGLYAVEMDTSEGYPMPRLTPIV